MPPPRSTYDLVIAANRLPVDQVVNADGSTEWRRSPGGLVTAMESVMRDRPGAWVGWAGDTGPAPEPFDEAGIHIDDIGLRRPTLDDVFLALTGHAAEEEPATPESLTGSAA